MGYPRQSIPQSKSGWTPGDQPVIRPPQSLKYLFDTRGWLVIPGVMTEDEIVELKKRGVKETHLDPEVYKKMNAGFIKGVWNFAINFNKKSKPRVQKLYEMAKANGDAPASLK